MLNLTTHSQKYCLINVKAINDAALATIQIRMISLAGRWWKVGGATKLPSSRPRKTTEPRKPSYALSMLKSSLMLRVMAFVAQDQTSPTVQVQQLESSPTERYGAAMPYKSVHRS